jgi:hypothetical protein
MAFVYKHGYFPTLEIDDTPNILLLSAKSGDGYVVYLMIGEGVVLETMADKRGEMDFLFERFFMKVEQEVANIMAGLKERKVSVEKEGWVLAG